MASGSSTSGVRRMASGSSISGVQRRCAMMIDTRLSIKKIDEPVVFYDRKKY
jgi:hypothetical protein